MLSMSPGEEPIPGYRLIRHLEGFEIRAKKIAHVRTLPLQDERAKGSREVIPKIGRSFRKEKISMIVLSQTLPVNKP